MPWFWGSSSSDPSSDAYNKLDPSLREFLDKESTVKYTPAPLKAPSSTPAASGEAPDRYRSQLGISSAPKTNANPPTSAATPPTTTTTTAAPSVPAESLYQDGRYASLWSSYRPLSEIEAGGKSDQDRLSDVIDAFNERKAQIGRAAVENCVFEQLAEKDCFVRGGWHARMTMCRDENRAFNRCYVMQSRFLKALGYLSMNRTAEEEERVQMHADKLYQEMMAREKAAEEAKGQGLPEPVFAPLIDAASTAKALGVEAPKQGLEIFPKEKRAEIEKSLKGKAPVERELEIQLRVAEAQASVEYGQKFTDYYEEERRHREDRRERGKETFGDAIKRMWGWDK